jgi:hypothetical protein
MANVTATPLPSVSSHNPLTSRSVWTAPYSGAFPNPRQSIAHLLGYWLLGYWLIGHWLLAIGAPDNKNKERARHGPFCHLPSAIFYFLSAIFHVPAGSLRFIGHRLRLARENRIHRINHNRQPAQSETDELRAVKRLSEKDHRNQELQRRTGVLKEPHRR